MADTLYDIPPEIKAIMAQMGPTDEDKKKAFSHGLLSAGFGILANAANNPWVAVGKGGTQGLLGYQQELQQGAQQRAANLSAASQIQGLGRRTQMDGIINNAIQSMFGGAPQTTGQTVPPSNNANVVTTPLTSTGEPGQPMPQDQGPPPQGMPQAQGGPPPMSRDGMARLGTLMALAKGGDITAANNFMFPKAFAGRANAPILDEAGRVLNPNPAPPQGSYYDPTTNSYKPVEGGKQAFMSAEAAKEAAKASIEAPSPRVDGSGASFVPPGSALQQRFPSGQLPYGVPGPNGQQQPQITPQVMDRAKAMEQANPGARVQLFETPSGAVSQGPQNGQPRSNMTSIGPQATSEYSSFGKALGDQPNAIDEKATAAMMMKSRVSEMKQSLQNFTPGALTPLKLKLGSLLQGLGMDPDTVTQKLGGVGDMEAFNKQALALAFDQTKQLTNRPAASEVLLAVKANPELSKSPQGTLAIIQYIEGLADWQLAQQQAKDAWLDPKQGGHTSMQGFMGQFNKENPIEKFMPSMSSLAQETGQAVPKSNSGQAKGLTQNSTAIARARQAIQQGKDPAAVRQRLIDSGVDPGGI